MIYQHQYFKLDAQAKRVWDENDKELKLAGNSFRLLAFLCEKKSANLTQIGDFLDWAKDYSENHLRQYRYKVNMIIGKNVIEYKNGVYAIVGGVKESLEIGKNERNTDLLHQNSLELKQDNNFSAKTMNFLKNRWVVIGLSCTLLLLLLLLGGRLLFGSPPVKKSDTGICHQAGTLFYKNTKNFTAFNSIEDCLKSGGRLPLR
ncbi:MAG: hypothetical protein WCJ51_01295 [Candidatus Moraniibacteriota bacterium]